MVERMEDIKMKAVSREQAVALSLRLGANVNWDQVDPKQLQTEVIDLSPAELGRRMTAFLKNGCRLQITTAQIFRPI